MKYKIEFQYKPGGQTRPLDYAQEHALIYEKGEYLRSRPSETQLPMSSRGT